MPYRYGAPCAWSLAASSLSASSTARTLRLYLLRMPLRFRRAMGVAMAQSARLVIPLAGAGRRRVAVAMRIAPIHQQVGVVIEILMRLSRSQWLARARHRVHRMGKAREESSEVVSVRLTPPERMPHGAVSPALAPPDHAHDSSLSRRSCGVPLSWRARAGRWPPVGRRKVVRGVVLTRSIPGLDSTASGTAGRVAQFAVAYRSHAADRNTL
jgi:hypothetical protein